MKKPKTQAAFATLTDAELEQLADWLRHETYEIVLDRVRKPRSDGGFDLNISRSPLERLYAKVALLDLINSKVSADKKLTLAQFDSIWGRGTGGAGVAPVVDGLAREGLSPLDVQSSPPETSPFPSVQIPELSADAHRAILETVHDLATSSDNTPTQLLALQRLADFPARAQIREERLDLDRQKFTHKREMDTFRKEIATTRLDLAKQSLALRQKQGGARVSRADSGVPPESSPFSDHLGPAARNWDEVGERARIHFDVSKEEWSRRQSLHENPDENRTPKNSENPNPNANPDLTPDLSSSVTTIRDEAEANVNDRATSSWRAGEAKSAQSTVNSPLLPLPPVDLETTVNAYNIRRAEEYWTWRAHHAAAALSGGQPPPPYITEHRHCPCGKPTPCPDHENETYGEFPTYFWSISPHLHAYEICLTARNLPYRDLSECVPEEFRIYRKRRD